jgi:hypothetical protein
MFSCSLRGLSDADIAALNAVLSEQVEANMGMAMIYVLVSAAQEWLREKVNNPFAPWSLSQQGNSMPKGARCHFLVPALSLEPRSVLAFHAKLNLWNSLQSNPHPLLQGPSGVPPTPKKQNKVPSTCG